MDMSDEIPDPFNGEEFSLESIVLPDPFKQYKRLDTLTLDAAAAHSEVPPAKRHRGTGKSSKKVC